MTNKARVLFLSVLLALTLSGMGRSALAAIQANDACTVPNQTRLSAVTSEGMIICSSTTMTWRRLGGTVQEEGNSSAVIQDTGTGSYLLRLDGVSTLSATAGRVGINTATPGSLLNVRGILASSDYRYSTTIDGDITGGNIYSNQLNISGGPDGSLVRIGFAEDNAHKALFEVGGTISSVSNPPYMSLKPRTYGGDVVEILKATSSGVSIGTPVVSRMLNVYAVNTSAGYDTGETVLALRNGGTTSNALGAGIGFQVNNSIVNGAVIAAVNHVTANAASLAFATRSTGGTLVEHMRLTSSGFLLVGYTSESGLGTARAYVNGAVRATSFKPNGDGEYLSGDGSGNLTFSTSYAQRAAINSTGLRVGHLNGENISVVDNRTATSGYFQTGYQFYDWGGLAASIKLNHNFYFANGPRALQFDVDGRRLMELTRSDLRTRGLRIGPDLMTYDGGYASQLRGDVEHGSMVHIIGAAHDSGDLENPIVKIDDVDTLCSGCQLVGMKIRMDSPHDSSTNYGLIVEVSGSTVGNYAALFAGRADSTHSFNAPAFNNTSDQRLKHDVTSIEPALAREAVRRLQGVGFTWNESGFQDVGFIAQQVEQALGDLVVGGASLASRLVQEDPNGIKSVRYANLTSLLVQAQKAQDAELDKVMARLSTLEMDKSRVGLPVLGSFLLLCAPVCIFAFILHLRHQRSR